jgi:ketol-acid reductoisomerase
MLLTPDETHAKICDQVISPSARNGSYIGFAAGFSVHYGVCRIREGLHPILVAPKGAGSVLRERYNSGRGIPALVAARPGDAAGLEIAKACAKALGCASAGVVTTTFREEAIADMFGEQCVLCGGLVELMKAAFDILVERGYRPEVAYIECVAEVESMASLISRVGLADLGRHISSTAFYGGATRGCRVIDSATRKRLEGILDDIESGRFYAEFRRHTGPAGDRRPDRGEFERMERARKAFRTEDRDAH